MVDCPIRARTIAALTHGETDVPDVADARGAKAFLASVSCDL